MLTGANRLPLNVLWTFLGHFAHFDDLIRILTVNHFSFPSHNFCAVANKSTGCDVNSVVDSNFDNEICFSFADQIQSNKQIVAWLRGCVWIDTDRVENYPSGLLIFIGASPFRVWFASTEIKERVELGARSTDTFESISWRNQITKTKYRG